MPIAIVVEDGTGVANANSYNALADVRTYCTDRSLTLPADDETVKAAMIKSMNFIEAFRDRYQGCKTNAANALQFPRERVRVDGALIANNIVPACLKQAHIQATYEVCNGTDLQPTTSGLFIKRDVTGPLETEYSETKATADGQDVVTAVVSLLKPLFIKQNPNRLGPIRF